MAAADRACQAALVVLFAAGQARARQPPSASAEGCKFRVSPGCGNRRAKPAKQAQLRRKVRLVDKACLENTGGCAVSIGSGGDKDTRPPTVKGKTAAKPPPPPMAP
jgi:hypothetical protein